MDEKVDDATGEVREVADTGIMGEIQKAEVSQQMVAARSDLFRRNITHFKSNALKMATVDEETAASCFYAIPRAGKVIEGPSARLAEIVASSWGNLRVEARVTGEDEKWVYAEATAWDMETNVAIKFSTRRRITDKYGKRYKDDMIGVTSNAAASIALRNAVFKVVPMCYVRSIYEQCRLVAMGEAKTLGARRGSMMDYFAKYGLTEERVLHALGKAGIDDVDGEDLLKLRGFANSIKDGELDLDAAFPEPPKELPDAGGKKQGFGFQGKPGEGGESAPETPDPAPKPRKPRQGRKGGEKGKPSPKPKPDDTPDPDTRAEAQRQVDALKAAEEAEKNGDKPPLNPGARGPDDDPPPPDEQPSDQQQADDLF